MNKDKKKVIEKVVEIPKINVRDATIRVVGTTAYISHKKGEDVIKAMRDKQAKVPKQARKIRDTQAEYAGSLYWLNKNGQLVNPNGDPNKHKTGFGIPARAFKQACVNACRSIKGSGMTMSLAKNAFFVLPEYIPVLNHNFKTFAQPKMREDLLSLPSGKGSADLRYRGEFLYWACILHISFNENVISLAQIANLLNLAGFGVGVGDDRPDKSGGTQGRFEIK